jgi:DNA recombination protein Rad52
MNLELLNEKLDASCVKQRDQNGMKLSYIEGHHAIREANRIFGFDGWTRDTVEMSMAQCEQKPTKNGDRWYVSYIAKSRISVAGVVRDGYGFGQGIDADLGRAHESASKEAETDAMKRALMTFGDPFGLALYDKAQEHVDKEPKAKKAPTPAPERKGKADHTAPFGWLMISPEPGEWQLAQASQKQIDYLKELLAQHGIDATLGSGIRSLLVRSYGLDVETINRSGGFSLAIEFLKDAPDDSIIACAEAVQSALSQKAGAVN